MIRRDFEAAGWIGVFAPTNTPAAVIQRISTEWQKARRQPDVAAKFDPLGWNTISFNTTEEFGAFIKTETVRWGKVIQDAGVKPE